jgi:hypothetical protein
MRSSPLRFRSVVRRIAGLFAIATLLSTLTGSASAQADKKSNDESGNGGNPRVLPPGSSAYGRPIADWTIAWWQWAYSLPFTEHPLFDESGALCANGQSGPVWFLGGIFNVTGTAVRTECVVPPGKALFFPVLNVEWDNVCPPASLTIPELRAQANAFADLAINMTCEIDGASVNNVAAYRYESAPFSLTLPEGNIWQAFGCTAPAGTYYPAVGDGYYLMVTPLSPGPHTIHFSGEFSGIFALDITYHLTVGTVASTAASDLDAADGRAPAGVFPATWGQVKAAYR